MIKLIKSTFHNEELTRQKLAEFVLNSELMSMNEQCRTFEERFAKKQGRAHAAFVGNGSVANLLLIQSMLNLGLLHRGDEVGFSALTWPTNVMPLIQLGLRPVPLDCSISTLNVPLSEIATHIAQIKALFLTNVLGFCDDLPAIRELCDQHSVILLEDNCESLGSRTNGTLLGNFGIASTFSFFVGHHLSTIEGGMVCTDDAKLHQELVMGRAHGWDRNLDPSVQRTLRSFSDVDEFYARYTFYDIASNFRPTEINGFLGNTQLEYWDQIVAKRVENFRLFAQAMAHNDDLYQYRLEHLDVPSNFAMPIVCKTRQLAEEYRERFMNAKVEIRPVIAGNVTKQPFYRKYCSETSHLPNSDIVHANGFYFGNNPDLSKDNLSTLCDLIRSERP